MRGLAPAQLRGNFGVVGNGGQMFAISGYCPQRLLKTGPELFSLQTAVNDFADGLEFGRMGSAAGGTLLITTCVTFTLDALAS
jgi:hypothetical protein